MDENEQMSNSLLSLTSHFAQVQFRLKQIIEGPEEHKSVSLWLGSHAIRVLLMK